MIALSMGYILHWGGVVMLTLSTVLALRELPWHRCWHGCFHISPGAQAITVGAGVHVATGSGQDGWGAGS